MTVSAAALSLIDADVVQIDGRVLSALKDTAHSPEERQQMLKQNEQNKDNGVSPVIAIAVGNIVTFMYCVTVCGV